jgi:dienelactone hydrolase
MLRWAFFMVSAIAFYLVTVALIPGFPEPRQPFPSRPRDRDEGRSEALYTKQAFRIKVSRAPKANEYVRGWFYLPLSVSSPVACVVMAHGLGGTVAAGLEPYARRFAAAGYAVLAFDYRHFGSSDGQPRQLIWIPTQLEDWQAAVRYAREHKDIDASRIALWGTSLSGGHVLTIASEDHAIACISAQCPGLDGHETAELGFRKMGWRSGVRMVIHAQRDLARSWLHQSPHKIPIVGKSGTTALMASEEAWNAMRALAPENYVNEACARIAIRGDKYRPVKKALHVRCPALLQICEYDEFTPVSVSEEAARSMGDLAQVKRYPINHFDIYFGEYFDAAVGDQLAFFSTYL